MQVLTPQISDLAKPPQTYLTKFPSPNWWSSLQAPTPPNWSIPLTNNKFSSPAPSKVVQQLRSPLSLSLFSLSSIIPNYGDVSIRWSTCRLLKTGGAVVQHAHQDRDTAIRMLAAASSSSSSVTSKLSSYPFFPTFLWPSCGLPCFFLGWLAGLLAFINQATSWPPSLVATDDDDVACLPASTVDSRLITFTAQISWFLPS